MSLPATPPDPDPVPIDLDDDDRLIGRILTRREVLALLGAGGAATFLAACAPGGAASPSATGAASASASASASAAGTASAAASAAIATALPACVVAPELTEGPYYVDVDLERSDIRTNTSDNTPVEGATLTLDWIVSQPDGSSCMPMEGVVVDVWHCDALGVYSGVTGNAGDFLRGFQRTDANGRASFTTVYPGWYRAARSTSTSRSGPIPRRRPVSSSRRNCSSTTSSAEPCTRQASTRRRAHRTRPTRPTRSSTRATGRRC